MHKFVNSSSFSVVSRDSNLFYQEIVAKIYSLTKNEFYKWLESDPNFCYLAMWLHPKTAYSLFDTKAKIIPMRNRSNYSYTVKLFMNIWNYETLRDTMIERHELFFRANSDYLFRQACNKYDRDVLSSRYLYMNLPFYYNGDMICKYKIKSKREKNNSGVKEVSKIIFEGRLFRPTFRPAGDMPLTTYQISISKVFQSSGFIPYGLCYAIDALEEILPIDICYMCVSYFLHPKAFEDLRDNEPHRILDFVYNPSWSSNNDGFSSDPE